MNGTTSQHSRDHFFIFPSSYKLEQLFQELCRLLRVNPVSGTVDVNKLSLGKGFFDLVNIADRDVIRFGATDEQGGARVR